MSDEPKKPWHVRLVEFVRGADGKVDEDKLADYANAHERARVAEESLAQLAARSRAREKALRKDVDRLTTDKAELTAVLELYADRSRWREYGPSRTVRALVDGGKVARRALGIR